MPISLQAKLLRVLQDSMVERVGSNKRIQVDARVISSTNQDLEAAVASGRFRQDLYYRLNVFHIAVPALRTRRDDIQPLAEFFLARYAREFGRGTLALAPDVQRLLESYRWPGNVRELQNVMERAAVLAAPGGTVDARLLGQLLPTVASEPTGAAETPVDGKLGPAVDAFERKFILRTLHAVGDNKAEAARVLGVSERTLWYKLKKHSL
jgi:transcriptional regulator with PAS, ATPase and Fis domain